jgi:hypothetical protein
MWITIVATTTTTMTAVLKTPGITQPGLDIKKWWFPIPPL